MGNIVISNGNIIEKETGEVLGSTKPKFSQWMYDDYLREFKSTKEVRFLEPMTAQELQGEKLEKYLCECKVIGEQKFDGHRGLLYLTSKGNRMFSRRVSKQTGWFVENTDQVPHIRDIEIPKELYGTVLDGEILLPIEGCTCRQVQSITGALPETAIQNQLERGFAYLNVFDILYYKGINIQRMPLWKRKLYLNDVVSVISSPYVKECEIFATEEVASEFDMLTEGQLKATIVEDLEQLFRDYLREGKEGIILKDLEGIYEQKRSKAYVKMKAKETFDVVIMDYEEPTRFYEGKALNDETLTHDWWEDAEDGSITVNKALTVGEANSQGLIPVTKFYAMDWIGAIIFGVWKDGKLVEVGRTSGMDEATRQAISEDREGFLGKVIEVEAQGIINKETGSLQHPRFICFREDKSSDMCTFEAHIREEI